ncbi:MAG TPA: hypothetical protein VJ719_03655 [Chthoniobacterales bacterium]|nr:hypothetical protein [Chthoniobacterales bacterium]
MSWFKRIFSKSEATSPTEFNPTPARTDPFATIGEALRQHSAELPAALTPERRRQVHSIWTETINTRAHDYADLILTYPDRDTIAKLHVDTIMQVYLNGYMAAQGWITENVALQSAFMLGRNLRDQIRGLGLPLDKLSANTGTTIDGALKSIVEVGIQSKA